MASGGHWGDDEDRYVPHVSVTRTEGGFRWSTQTAAGVDHDDPPQDHLQTDAAFVAEGPWLPIATAALAEMLRSVPGTPPMPSWFQETQLIECARRGDLPGVMAFVLAGVDGNAHRSGTSALGEAVRGRHPTIVSWLLGNGTRVASLLVEPKPRETVLAFALTHTDDSAEGRAVFDALVAAGMETVPDGDISAQRPAPGPQGKAACEAHHRPLSPDPYSIQGWMALDAAQRDALQAAFQRIADGEGAALKWSGVESLDPQPTVEVLGARHEGALLSVQFRYEMGIFRFAQSGSDWTEIHTHIGEAICRDGEVVSHTLERSERSFIDRD